jgi:hypothetical protein
MKKLIGAVSALALMGGAGMALADEATGTIQSFDQEEMTLVLDRGETFTLTEDLAIEGLEEGAEVKVAFEEQDGRLVATAIEHVDLALAEEAEEEVTEMIDEAEEEEAAAMMEDDEPEEAAN